MGQNSYQIEHQIELERGRLSSNINELQSRVQDATDWRVQFQKRPMLAIGIALGGGLLLSSTTARRRSRRYYSENRSSAEFQHRRGTVLQKNKALETFDTIRGAMIGVAANTFKDWLGELIPGFRDQFQRTAQEKRSGTAQTTPESPSVAAAG